MVDTVQLSRTGGGALGKAAIKAKEIEKGTHKLLLYQHNTMLFGLTITLSRHFLIFTLLLLLKEE
jgi:hypothetical protein